MYLNEYLSIVGAIDKILCDNENGWKAVDGLSDDDLEVVKVIGEKANAYAEQKVRREFEQGFQSWEMKFNSVASSRGDYPFTALTFGLGTSKWESMASSVCMKVRADG